MNNNYLKNTLITKVAVFFSFALIVFIGFLIVPKRLMSRAELYDTAVSLAKTDDDNSVFYDYKVYGSDKRFNEGLSDDVPVVAETFKKEKDILMVKIPGETRVAEQKDGYWLVQDPSVPELNIEYYILKNVDFANYSLPSRTFITAGEGLLMKANTIYAVAIVTTLILVDTPLIIFGIFSAKKLKSLPR